MSKGIATQTILLMLVGIIVVGIIIFIVYRMLTGPSLTEGECRARMITACMFCKNAGWDSTDGVPSDLTNKNGCAKPGGIFEYWADNTQCNKGSMVEDCKQLGIE